MQQFYEKGKFNNMAAISKGKQILNGTLKILFSVAALALLLTLSPAASLAIEQDADGTYLIATKEDLEEFRSVAGTNASANARLTSDIDMGGRWTPIAGHYSGTFDGAGHTISNYTITECVTVKMGSGSYPSAGFFAALDSGASVRNLTVTGSVDISSTDHAVGGIVGYNDGGAVENCVNDGENVTVNMSENYAIQYCGGIVGRHRTGRIENCINNASVTAQSGSCTREYAGGIVGYVDVEDGGTISGCVNTGAVMSKEEQNIGYNYAGGIVGYTSSSSIVIENCVSTGAVYSSSQASFFGEEYAGGIIGQQLSSCTVTNCAWVAAEDGNAQYGVGDDYGADGVTKSESDADSFLASTVLGVRLSSASLEVKTGNTVPLVLTAYPATNADLSTLLSGVTATPKSEGIVSADVALPNIQITGLAGGATQLSVTGKLNITNFSGSSTQKDVELVCSVSVTNAAVAGVSLSQSELELTPGGTAALTYTTNPTYAVPGSVEWTSSDTSVVTVADGTVTAVAEGEATVTLTVDEHTATCRVTVAPAVVEVVSISLDETVIEMTVGEQREAPAYAISPADASNKEVQWSSSDASILSVEQASGTMTAVSAGTAELRVTTVSGGHTAVCTVNVTASSEPGTGDGSAGQSSGSGGGCSAGFGGALALIAFAPLVLRRKR